MNVKLFEVRDRATLMPVMAVRLTPVNKAESWLLARSGFGETLFTQMEYILLSGIEGGFGKLISDPYDHDISELREAHVHILKNWEELDHGAVIDLEFIRGEVKEPKKSDRLNNDY